MSVDAVLTESAIGYDIGFDVNGDIDTDDFFDTAILLSLFCERRATASEVPESHRRRGWIGNEQGDGFEIGSKIWLFEQERVTRSLLSNIEKIVFNSLSWLIEDKFAVNVVAIATIKNNTVTLTVEIETPSSKVERRFFDLWTKTGIR